VTCREFIERLADDLDDGLLHRSHRGMRSHASRCRGCRTYRAQYCATRTAVAALAEWDDLDAEGALDLRGC
jgi:hypothetical protein